MHDRAAEFPLLANTTYLNTCAQSPLSRRVRASVESTLNEWETMPDWSAMWTHIEAARKRFARFLGADDDEVALSYSASAALSSVATALRFDGGRDRAVTLDLDFPSNPVVWGAQKNRGMRHEYVPHFEKTGRATFTADDLTKVASRDTAVVAVPHASSFTGARLDLASLAGAAHDAGALLAVDGFQACGTERVDVHELDVDVYVTGTYKWLLGTSGLAMLYVKRDVQERLMGEPLVTGWYALEDPGAFDPEAPRARSARRFEIGAPGMPQLAATSTGMDLLDEVGLENVRANALTLTGAIIEACDARGWKVTTPTAPDSRSAIVTFTPPHIDRVLAALAEERVVAGARQGRVRVAVHYYNTRADVARLFEVADAAVKRA